MTMNIYDVVKAIDWDLFRAQKEYLVAMSNDDDRLTEEIQVLDGVLHLMDAIQDAADDMGLVTTTSDEDES